MQDYFMSKPYQVLLFLFSSQSNLDISSLLANLSIKNLAIVKYGS